MIGRQGQEHSEACLEAGINGKVFNFTRIIHKGITQEVRGPFEFYQAPDAEEQVKKSIDIKIDTDHNNLFVFFRDTVLAPAGLILFLYRWAEAFPVRAGVPGFFLPDLAISEL
jgi:hypothetical protein